MFALCSFCPTYRHDFELNENQELLRELHRFLCACHNVLHFHLLHSRIIDFKKSYVGLLHHVEVFGMILNRIY